MIFFHQPWHGLHELDPAGLQFALDHNFGDQGEPLPGQRQQAQQRHVVHFRVDKRFDARIGQQQVEVRAHIALAAGQKEGDVLQELGKARRGEFEFFAAHQKDRHFAEGMVEQIRLLIRAQGDVGEHQVHPVLLQLAGQFVQRAGHHHHFRAGVREDRLDKIELEVLGERSHRADAEQPQPGVLRLAQAGQQLVARGENRLGMLQCHPPGVGQVQFPAAPLKERLAEPVFQLGELLAQGGLRNV